MATVEDDVQPSARASDSRGPARPPGAALGVSLFVAAVLVPLVRHAAGRPWDTVWAEDGAVFIQDANTLPLHQTLFRSYAGYAHLLPRILAVPTRYLPVDWIAAYTAVAGAVVGALVALFVWRACGSHVRDSWARLALAGACVLSGVMAFENEVTLVNLQWVVTFATFWAIMSRQAGRYDVASRGLVAFLGTASSPVAGIYLPLVLAVAWTRRQRSDLVVAGAYLTGLTAQLAVILAAGNSSDRASSSVSDFGVMYAVRVLASAAVGEVTAVDLWLRWGETFAWVALALGAAAAVAIWPRIDKARARTALVAVACSFPLFAIPVFLRGSSLSRLAEGIYNHGGTRYFVTPVLLVVSAAAIICGTAAHRWLPKALAAQVVLVGAVSLGAGAEWRIDGPSWTDGVRAAETACVATPEPAYGIPIAPAGAWQTWMPCSRIED